MPDLRKQVEELLASMEAETTEAGRAVWWPESPTNYMLYKTFPAIASAYLDMIHVQQKALEYEARLEEQNAALLEAVNWAYQLAGLTQAGVESLDNLSALAQGLPAPHEWKAATSALMDENERLKKQKTYWETWRQRVGQLDQLNTMLLEENERLRGGTREVAHDYLSTACFHGLHERCRRECKFCGVQCRCECHTAEADTKEKA